jgi:hypothetical protein
MRRRATLCGALTALALALAILAPASPAAAAVPHWELSASSMPTHFAPGSGGETAGYFVLATNVGAGATSGSIEISDTLPAGISPDLSHPPSGFTDDPASAAPACAAPVGQKITCTVASGHLHPGLALWLRIPVSVASLPDPSLLTDEAEVSGGGAPGAVASTTTTITSTPAGFGFLPGEAGLTAPFSAPDGSAVTRAGSHPYQLSVGLGFPTDRLGGALVGAGGQVRDVIGNLPRGVAINPAAAVTRCTEAELDTQGSQGLPGCPASSQVGTVSPIVVTGTPSPVTTPLYSMVPPAGAPAAFGFDAVGAGVFVHLIGSVRSDGDFGLSGQANDILALTGHAVLGARLELWGDPADHGHDFVRGQCLVGVPRLPGPCETLEPQQTAFVTLPSDCPGSPSVTTARADSWGEPGVFREASSEAADLGGNPAPTDGCNELQFEPTIQSRPTTNVADSPSGLDVNVHQPQELGVDETYGTRSTAPLKDATVTLPPGMVANASQANGLGACSSAQIGLTTPIGATPIHLDKAPDGCPDAAKIGTLEVSTPLLDQYEDEGTKLAREPGTGLPIPEPLHGSVYLAKPFDNPFGSLLAIYFSIDDPKTGTVAKLAGKVESNPVTGQLTTRFTENPELPLEDIGVHLFSGPRASLQTPPACGTQTTAADLTPWSSPEGADALLSDSFQTTAAPGGGACPSSEALLPNSPAFSAGTVRPAAGAYSPLLFRLSRADGSQRLAKLETTLPAGLIAKLAGVSECTDAQIAAARARERPNEGALEEASPSCPQSSELGTVEVGAGAGPEPIYVQGRVYLAGPYEGAPISTVAITPAIAGPFDLGAVVVRIPLFLDPATAQAHIVSDPFPTILDGIPVNVRSIAVRADRPDFTLNPTSCDPKQFTGSVTSTLNQLAPLSQSFQVGGCSPLPYKPKLSIRLFGSARRGANPRMRAVFKAKPGEANTARAVLALPHSEFLDQAHIRTICTRVQYAANQCPEGSIYGYVRVFSPLVDYPLEGPIYGRSSNHELPDAVAALRGPPGQPLAFDVAGRLDSVNGGLRVSLETVPDAPIRKAVFTVFGGKRGLLQNSTNVCVGDHRADLKLDGQNGKVHDSSPMLKAQCGKAARRKRGH